MISAARTDAKRVPVRWPAVPGALPGPA